jgi:glycosyltransferase involved in cell wall biosynthesis
MKVLWFSNTPANSDDFLEKELRGTGGWLKTLDALLQEKVDLHVAFYSAESLDNFRYLNTSYHPILKDSRNFIDKVIERFWTRVWFREDVDKYLKIINDVKPDIIHIHGTELPFGYIQEITKVPVVISIQGNITVYKHKYFSGIEKRNINWFYNLVQRVFQNNSFLKSYQYFKKWEFGEQEILKECKYIIGRTDWDYRVTRILAPKSSYFYVSEILRASFYKSNELPINQNKLVISTTNGNSLYKGFETLCYAISILNNTNSQNFEWRVAGIKETDPIVKVVRRKLGKNYPNKNLVLMGSMNESQLVSSLLETSIYVMPSHIENSPNNLSEAMLLGIPCIATFAGGTGSLIENNQDGILIQDGDPWALAGAIIELKANYQKAQEMGSRGRLKAMKRHNSGIIIEDLLNVYKYIVERQ